MIEAMLPT